MKALVVDQELMIEGGCLQVDLVSQKLDFNARSSFKSVKDNSKEKQRRPHREWNRRPSKCWQNYSGLPPASATYPEEGAGDCAEHGLYET